MFIVTVVGVLFMALFQTFTRDPSSASGRTHTGQVPPRSQYRWSTWFGIPAFYLVGIVYTATRVYGIITQVYLAQYLLDSLILDKATIAQVTY